MSDTEPSGSGDVEQLDTDARAAFEEGLRARLGEVYSANPWLVTSEVEQGAVRQAADIRATGGGSVLAVGARPGVGPLDPTVELIAMNLPEEGTMIRNIHSAQKSMVDPPAEIQAKVDAWDPKGLAKSMGGLTTNAGTLFGRPIFGARLPEWAALEDKLAIEEVWASAGIPVAPSAQVALADPDALLAAHRELATSLGTVWAGDNTMGWHGGADGTFWVPDEASAATMVDRLPGYRNVRIMPFLEGIPCSVHGMVLPAEFGVAAFRPCEMMMLRNPVANELFYGRTSTYWDPAPADRLEMQQTARMVGNQLRSDVGYRGVFTVDGIMTAEGFRPTEVNTRYGAALPSEMTTVSGEPLHLFQVHMALVEGLLDDVDLAPLENWATANLDRERRFRGFIATDHVPDIEHHAQIGRNPDGSLEILDRTGLSEGQIAADGRNSPDDDPEGGPLLAVARWGAAPFGGLLSIEAKNGVPVGPPAAQFLLEITEAIAPVWNIQIPPLVAARQVR